MIENSDIGGPKIPGKNSDIVFIFKLPWNLFI